MKLDSFQCKSCGTLIFLENSVGENPWCPLCRSDTIKVDITIAPEKTKEYTCPNCGVTFKMRKGDEPYKCPRCNHTFLVSPGREFEERL